VTAITSQDSGGAVATGLVAVGDKLIITFSEPLKRRTVPTTFAATGQTKTCPITSGSAECSGGATNALLIIPGITTAAGADTGSPLYVKGGGTKDVGIGGTIALSSNNTVVTLNRDQRHRLHAGRKQRRPRLHAAELDPGTTSATPPAAPLPPPARSKLF